MNLSVIITSFFSLNTLAQECPGLPKNGFSSNYHQKSIDLYDSRLLKGDHYSSHENQIDLQKDKQLKQRFNRILWKVKQAECTPDEVLENKLFLFQTCELVKKDSSSYLTLIQNKHEHISFNKTPNISVVYGGIYQRDLSIRGDSMLISNWYIKQFSSNEIKEITEKRKKLAFLADSLNLEINKLEEKKDWQLTQGTINALRKQRTPIATQRDSIDFILYPSLLLEMESWYEQQFEREINSPFHPESYLGLRGFGQKTVIIDSDTASFLKRKFRLHHVFDNNPYSGESIFMGDSIILEGQAIFNAKYIREDNSAWRDGDLFYWSLNEKYLIAVKRESNIGETYWDIRNTYYIYEVIE